MMTRIQYLLGKLAEESGELAQVSIKAQQFGLNETFAPIGRSNRERIREELTDVMTLAHMISQEIAKEVGVSVTKEELINVDTQRFIQKQLDIKDWYQYAVGLGNVEPWDEE